MRLERIYYRPNCTVGHLFVNDVLECFTLEDGIRTTKVYGETAIPAGRYPVVVNYSPRFKTTLPLLRDVPNFKGIRIHPGNAPKDTLGCILVGRSWKNGAEVVTASRSAFATLNEKIVTALGRGELVQLAVIQNNAPPDLAGRAPRRVEAGTRSKARSKRKRITRKATAQRSVAPKKRPSSGAGRSTTRRK